MLVFVLFGTETQTLIDWQTYKPSVGTASLILQRCQEQTNISLPASRISFAVERPHVTPELNAVTNTETKASSIDFTLCRIKCEGVYFQV